MKKIDLLHTTILIVAILCGYSALRQLLGILNASVFYYSDVFSTTAGGVVVPTLIQVALYSIACIILVRNSKRIATYLLGNDRPEYEEFLEAGDADSTNIPPGQGEKPDNLKWQLDRQSILFVFFIGLGLYTLIEYVPGLLNSIIADFKDKVNGALRLIQPGRRDYRDYLILDLLHVTIGALLIYAAPTLTNFIERTIAGRLNTGSKTS
jgi:hypothetical protein